MFNLPLWLPLDFHVSEHLGYRPRQVVGFLIDQANHAHLCGCSSVVSFDKATDEANEPSQGWVRPHKAA